MEAFAEYGPVWILVGVLLTALIKMFYSLVKLVENNTVAITKLTETVSHCSKNKQQ